LLKVWNIEKDRPNTVVEAVFWVIGKCYL